MDNQIELKPCPFCGSTNVKIEENSIEYEDGEIEEDWLIECHGCGSAFIASNDGMPCTKDELIARWNRRAEQTGEWLEDEYGYCRCSRCGYEHDQPETTTPYCPECGARMGGVAEVKKE